MKKGILILLNIFVVVGSIAFLVYYLFFAEVVKYDRIAKCVIVLVSYLLATMGIKDKRSVLDYKVYEELYKPFINGAFSDDKKNYRELLEVTVYYNRSQYKKAYKLLDKLEKKCMRSKDFAAVHMFRALCLDDEKKKEQAAVYYQKALNYDMANSHAWSNMGYCHMQLGKSKEAYEAYSNAILYDSKNPFAYNNLGVYYIRQGNAQQALENALRALELDSRMYQAMSTAAMAYKLLGDNANAEKYTKMYGINGGDAKKLKAALASM